MVLTRSQRRRTADKESVHSVSTSKSGLQSQSKVGDRYELRSSSAATTDVETRLRVIDHRQPPGCKSTKSNRSLIESDTFVIDQTMTYLCSGLHETTQPDNAPPDCTCFFLNMRNRVDLQNFGDADSLLAGNQRAPLPDDGNSTRAKFATSLLVGAVILSAGYYLLGDVWIPESDEETVSEPNSSSDKKGWFYYFKDYLLHVFF